MTHLLVSGNIFFSLCARVNEIYNTLLAFHSFCLPCSFFLSYSTGVHFYLFFHLPIFQAASLIAPLAIADGSKQLLSVKNSRRLTMRSASVVLRCLQRHPPTSCSSARLVSSQSYGKCDHAVRASSSSSSSVFSASPIFDFASCASAQTLNRNASTSSTLRQQAALDVQEQEQLKPL